jgi:hypothetical protein
MNFDAIYATRCTTDGRLTLTIFRETPSPP